MIAPHECLLVFAEPTPVVRHQSEAIARPPEARHPGAKTYSDWKEMLDTEPLDIVSVCTYTVDPVRPCRARPQGAIIGGGRRTMSGKSQMDSLMAENWRPSRRPPAAPPASVSSGVYPVPCALASRFDAGTVLSCFELF